ncbi:MAG: hypothetical protein J6O90_01880 [Candidatus Methanomethylophilaceae archaeon]|nr:hypothetical protein [Candidatus Methanomethylophilaceae archaeon]
MRYEHIVTGTFINRPNRFIAMVDVSGTVERCHVKNTGRRRVLQTAGGGGGGEEDPQARVQQQGLQDTRQMGGNRHVEEEGACHRECLRIRENLKRSGGPKDPP